MTVENRFFQPPYKAPSKQSILHQQFAVRDHAVHQRLHEESSALPADLKKELHSLKKVERTARQAAFTTRSADATTALNDAVAKLNTFYIQNGITPVVQTSTTENSYVATTEVPQRPSMW